MIAEKAKAAEELARSKATTQAELDRIAKAQKSAIAIEKAKALMQERYEIKLKLSELENGRTRGPRQVGSGEPNPLPPKSGIRSYILDDSAKNDLIKQIVNRPLGAGIDPETFKLLAKLGTHYCGERHSSIW